MWKNKRNDIKTADSVFFKEVWLLLKSCLQTYIVWKRWRYGGSRFLGHSLKSIIALCALKIILFNIVIHTMYLITGVHSKWYDTIINPINRYQNHQFYKKILYCKPYLFSNCTTNKKQRKLNKKNDEKTMCEIICFSKK